MNKLTLTFDDRGVEVNGAIKYRASGKRRKAPPSMRLLKGPVKVLALYLLVQASLLGTGKPREGARERKSGSHGELIKCRSFHPMI